MYFKSERVMEALVRQRSRMASSLRDRGLELMAARRNRVRGRDKTRQDISYVNIAYNFLAHSLPKH